VIIDRSAQVLEFPASNALTPPVLDIGTTEVAVDVAEILLAEKIEQVVESRRCFSGSRMCRGLLLLIEGDNVCYKDLRG
jgi:hypothetical protein